MNGTCWNMTLLTALVLWKMNGWMLAGLKYFYKSLQLVSRGTPSYQSKQNRSCLCRMVTQTASDVSVKTDICLKTTPHCALLVSTDSGRWRPTYGDLMEMLWRCPCHQSICKLSKDQEPGMLRIHRRDENIRTKSLPVHTSTLTTLMKSVCGSNCKKRFSFDVDCWKELKKLFAMGWSAKVWRRLEVGNGSGQTSSGKGNSTLARTFSELDEPNRKTHNRL